jgi:hypothetical protein
MYVGTYVILISHAKNVEHRGNDGNCFHLMAGTLIKYSILICYNYYCK